MTPNLCITVLKISGKPSSFCYWYHLCGITCLSHVSSFFSRYPQIIFLFSWISAVIDVKWKHPFWDTTIEETADKSGHFAIPLQKSCSPPFWRPSSLSSAFQHDFQKIFQQQKLLNSYWPTARSYFPEYLPANHRPKYWFWYIVNDRPNAQFLQVCEIHVPHFTGKCGHHGTLQC